MKKRYLGVLVISIVLPQWALASEFNSPIELSKAQMDSITAGFVAGGVAEAFASAEGSAPLAATGTITFVEGTEESGSILAAASARAIGTNPVTEASAQTHTDAPTTVTFTASIDAPGTLVSFSSEMEYTHYSNP